jgi:AcrR family transcriptional regulator
MAKRSDARQKMVRAATQLIRERGYSATAVSDVLDLSDAPRGSVYHHFPGGKSELGMEAAAAHAHSQIELIDRVAEQAEAAAGFIERYVDLGRDSMEASGYGRGCGIAPLVIDGATQESAALGETARRGFSEMVDRLAFHFIVFGLDRPNARELAEGVVAGVEGAMITSRALHDPSPFNAVRALLVDRANRLSSASAQRRS